MEVKGYQSRTNQLNDDNVIDCQTPQYFEEVKEFFCQLLNRQKIVSVWQTQIHVIEQAEPSLSLNIDALIRNN